MIDDQMVILEEEDQLLSNLYLAVVLIARFNVEESLLSSVNHNVLDKVHKKM